MQRTPNWKMIRKIYYGSATEGFQTDTECEEVAQDVMLQRVLLEMAQLKKENADLREVPSRGNLGGRAAGSQEEIPLESPRRVPPTPQGVERFAMDSEDDDFGSCGEESNEEGGMAQLLKKFKALGGLKRLDSKNFATSGGARRTSPGRAARGASVNSPGRRVTAGAAAAERRAALHGRTAPDRGAAARDPRARSGRDLASGQPVGDELRGVDMNSLVQLEILKALTRTSARTPSTTPATHRISTA